jgi:hypothetical protein
MERRMPQRVALRKMALIRSGHAVACFCKSLADRRKPDKAERAVALPSQPGFNREAVECDAGRRLMD